MNTAGVLFSGVVDPDGTIVFDRPDQVRAYCRRVLAGAAVDLTVAPRGLLKTRAQETGFHAMIAPWARDVGVSVDDLKRDLLREVFGMREHVNAITGEVDLVLREPHTSTLPRAQYSELIERTLTIAAECGQLLEAPQEYRERLARTAGPS